MRRTRIITIMLLSVLCIAASSCKKKEILTFGGQMDQFAATDENGQKTYLGHAEQWIYWESDDKIKVYDGSNAVECELVSGARSLEAFFRSTSTLNTDATLFAIYPSSSYGDSYTDLVFPATQPYRENEDATHPDSSFGRGALPMVAFDAEGMANRGTIYFHVVAGILRVQIYSSTSRTISQITFKEVGSEHGASNKQISGHFTVHDINQNAPYLTGTSVTDDSRTIVINNINKHIGPNDMLTFYLPLPAVTSASAVTNYKLRMTVKTDNNYYFSRDFSVDIHRRNITMMRALNITSWSATEGGSSSSDVRLVGSGTKDRPFQIYTGKELMQLRDAYNSGGTINGQAIRGYSESSKDEPTYVKIVRSDIVLLNSEDWYTTLTAEERSNPNSRYALWTTGIQNFKGYMYFASSTATNGGITNQSDKPLFESIASDGYVYRVYVKGTCTPTELSEGGSYSPMCNVNNGTMKECHNKCEVTTSVTNARLAGLCVNNAGKIIGGANEARLTSTNGNVAGICYNNNGVIQGNFTLSIATPQGLNIAGITFNNNDTVRDCQVSSNSAINSTGNWGVIAFNNNEDAVIDNCVSTGTLVYTIDGSVGGICNVNDGIVKNCSNGVELRASSGNVGGVVATMNNANAEIYNCCTRAPFLYGAIDAQRVADNIGGVVGYLGAGKVYNCYNASFVSGAINSGGIIGLLANNAAADVQNSWSAQGQGFVGLYENIAEHEVGPFCFTATIDSTFCNRIANATITVSGTQYDPYEVVSMHAEQTLNGYVANPRSFEGQHCGNALNTWVAWRASTGDTRNYYTWTANAGSRPVFNTGMPGGDKKGRGRR